MDVSSSTTPLKIATYAAKKKEIKIHVSHVSDSGCIDMNQNHTMQIHS
jgi:hypothetical protein